MTKLEEHRARIEQQEKKAREAQQIDLWLKTTGTDVEPCDANTQLIVHYFHEGDEEDRDFGEEITKAGLEGMMEDFRSRNEMPLALRTGHGEWKKRFAAIDELLGLFRDRDPNFLAVERRKLDFTPTEEILQLLQNAKEGRRLSALSVDELKRERDAAKPAQPAVTLDPSRFTRGILLVMAPNQLRLLMQQLDVRSGIPGTGNRLVTERINNIS